MNIKKLSLFCYRVFKSYFIYSAMHIDELREYCLSKPGAEETFPFNATTLVYKVMGKMFVMCNIDTYTGFNAKCDPEKAIDLREQYPDGVLPGYHMNKKQWNTIVARSNVPEALQKKLVDHSYELVVEGLSLKLKRELKEL